MLPAVIQQVQDSTTEDPYVGNHRAAVMISEHFNIKVSHETINRICGLLRRICDLRPTGISPRGSATSSSHFRDYRTKIRRKGRERRG
jgi:hypothetical protein